MRTALEVIRRLEWDPACCAAAVVVGYHDRILGEIVERPLDAFSRWGAIELADENELAIPQHRVVYFKSGDAIVWDKRRIYDGCRLDGVYGSTGHVKVDLSEIAARRRGPITNDRPRHVTTTGRLPVPMTARPAYLCAARARRLREESGGGRRRRGAVLAPETPA